MSKPKRNSWPKWVVFHKKRGETPLQVLEAWKKDYIKEHPDFVKVSMSYAGRLDPMAEGKLLVLIGEECKRQERYTKLDKEYEVEIVLGVKTDTGDVLGFPTLATDAGNLSNNSLNTNANYLKGSLRRALAAEIGAHSRKYPIFSSKTVNGKPLFLYALEGSLDSIQIPEHTETIYRLTLENMRTTSALELKQEIQRLLANVPRSDEPSKLLGADFRQDEVRVRWQELFSNVGNNREFMIIKIRVTCGSGAYMRTLAERIGVSLGTTALTLSINRTKIGKYFPLTRSHGIWAQMR